MAKLKVFRTAIGFHDAYVAAPSRKAALAAWGSDKDLFARGAAEEVTDPDLAAEALAQPGTVIKRLRGTAAEQLASLPTKRARAVAPRVEDEPSPVRPRRSTRSAAKAKPAGEPRAAPPPPSPPPPPPPTPKPSRDALDEAEAALSRAKAEQADALAEIARREAALARERRMLERDAADATRRLLRQRDAAAAAYEDAMRRWRG